MAVRRLPILIAAALALSAAPALAQTVTVHVAQSGLSFTQQSVVISPGDTIHWVWDATHHSVTSGSPPGTADGKFDSGVQDSLPATFDRTFNATGTFHYFCKIHYGSGMVGTITVSTDAPPTAAFTTSPPVPVAGQSATFDASASSDTDGDTITSYHWDFGDGITQTTSSSTIAHAYATAGPYDAKLTVSDSRGSSSALLTHTVTVSSPPPDTPPTAGFTSTPAPASPPPPPPASAPPPVAGKLHLSATSFCVKRSRRCRHPGVRIGFTLSERAELVFVVRHRGHTVRHAALTGRTGRNSFAFSGAGLHAGDYVLILTPAGGKAVQVAFTVLAR
jgi:plastocyanin